MNDKKPETLTGAITSPRKYDSSNVQTPQDPVKEMEKMKNELEDIKKKIVKKFSFTLAFSILPADSFKFFEEDEGLLPEEVARKPLHALLIIPEDEYKNIPKKIKPEILKIIHDSKQNVWVHIKTPVDLWNYGLDSKFEFLDAIGRSLPLHDKGLLGALRVATIHRSLVLRKFEKYVASYCIGGSLVRGTADKTSDVDTFVIIDDTDVKRMSRIELLEKLRGIIYDYIREATALSGVKNPLNVQVYLLTDFWQQVKDAHPVMFTFIRDGVPLYDRGTFLPWKLLLKMGKIKPSPEAVDMFMKSGDQTESIVNRRLIDAMIDIYYGVITPTQALMMLAGHAPPVPKTMVEEVREAFVVKEKLMTEKDLKTLGKVVKLFKDYEHGKLNKISGKEIDALKQEGEVYIKNMKELRQKLEVKLQEHLAEKMTKDLFDVLKQLFGNKSNNELIKDLENQLVKKGKIAGRAVNISKEVAEVKKKVASKKMSPNEMQRISGDAFELIDSLIEYAQRKDLVAVQKGVMMISYNGRKGELILTEDGVFVAEPGSLKKLQHHKLVDVETKVLEEAMKKTKLNLKLSLSSKLMIDLKQALGDFEIEL